MRRGGALSDGVVLKRGNKSDAEQGKQECW
jgi:hypothetical protein